MSKIQIEIYKNQTIYYNDELDRFTCDMELEDLLKSSTRASLKALRTEIDKFVKENLNFKPFKILRSKYGDNNFTPANVVAIRTDGKFILQSFESTYKEFVSPDVLEKDSREFNQEYVDLINDFEKRARELYVEKRKKMENFPLIKINLSKYKNS